MRQVRLYQSLVRPHLLMGAERSATMINAFFAAVVYFFTMSLPGIIVAVSLFLVAQVVLVQLAKSDAQMIAVVKRSRKYQTFYADGASLDAPYRDIEQSQPAAPGATILSWIGRAGTSQKNRKNKEKR